MNIAAVDTRRPYYGWVMVLTLAFTCLSTFGVLYYAFTVFIAPMQHELHWTRAEVSAGFSLSLLVSGLVAIPAGYVFDHYGTRWATTIGSVLAVLLVVAWSQVQTLPMFYLIHAGLGVSMALGFYEPAFVVVATWFRRNRGRALTLLTFIAGWASVIYLPLTEFFVRELGWRNALLMLALLLAVLTIPLQGILLRRRPQDMGLMPDGDLLNTTTDQPVAEESYLTTRQVMREGSFWALTGSFVLSTLVVTVLNVHLVPILLDGGFESMFAAAAGGLIGAMSLPGRLIFTLLGDYLPRGKVIAAIFALQTLALAVLALATTESSVILFVVLFGAGFGAIAPARAAVIADFYGTRHYGRISSMMGLCLTVARTFAPLMAGILHDVMNTYTPMLWGIAVLSIFSILPMLMMKKEPLPMMKTVAAASVGD